MKALFLVSEPISDYSGISKKILSQVKALNALGIPTQLSHLKVANGYRFLGRYVDGQQIDRYSRISAISKLQRRSNYKNLFKYIQSQQVNLLYIRYVHFANPFFISFLKKLKKKGVIILMEIPTYPYDPEYDNASFAARLGLFIEKQSRKNFHKYISRIVTVTEYQQIFGIPAIQVSNGIDIHSIRQKEITKKDDHIHLIGVATISFWHGYDRVIHGLADYYTRSGGVKREVHFHIVGDISGEVAKQYLELVKKLDLGNFVHFYGKKSGKELDDLFDKMDIAVGSLGIHRIGINNSRSLKNREYCARGIPFFYSGKDEDFESQPFTFKVSLSDDPINIQQVVTFLERYNLSPAELRHFATERLTWEKQFGKLLVEIQNAFSTP